MGTHDQGRYPPQGKNGNRGKTCFSETNVDGEDMPVEKQDRNLNREEG